MSINKENFNFSLTTNKEYSIMTKMDFVFTKLEWFKINELVFTMC